MTVLYGSLVAVTKIHPCVTIVSPSCSTPDTRCACCLVTVGHQQNLDNNIPHVVDLGQNLDIGHWRTRQIYCSCRGCVFRSAQPPCHAFVPAKHLQYVVRGLVGFVSSCETCLAFSCSNYASPS